MPTIETRESSTGLQVLLVEDCLDAAHILAVLLRLDGHSVVLASNGPTALLMAQQQTPDVVLLDIGLPGMSGYEVARRLRARPETQDILIIAVTGYGQESDREKAGQAGCDLHLLKPVDYHELHGLLARVITCSRK